MSKCQRYSASVTASNGWKWYTPALFTSTSSLPSAFLVSAKSRRTSLAFETSPWTAIAVPPVSLISATTRSAPVLLDA